MKRKNANAWRGLATLTASLTAAACAATPIVNANASFLNTRLGTTNTLIVDEGDGSADTNYFKSQYSSVADVIAAKEALAEEIGSEGLVLLKNTNDALPMAKSEKVTVWGMNSANPVLGGQIGSSVSVNDEAGQEKFGIVEALQNRGFDVNQNFIDLYASDAAKESTKRSMKPSFGPIYESPSEYAVGEITKDFYTDDILASADDTTAVVFLSRGSSEAADYEKDMQSSDANDSYERPFALSQNEQDMIALAKQHSTKVVVLLNSTNPLEIEGLKDDADIDSIAWVGNPGSRGFLGMVDALDGDVTPSGHLTDTYASLSTSSPAMVNFGVYNYTNNSASGASDAMLADDKSDWFVVEGEGIYNGYKYYETRYEDSVLGQGNADATEGSSTGSAWNYGDEVTYAFGYGLSYTTFEQTLDSVEVNVGGESTATVTVTNTGDVAGKSVAELFVQAPYTEGGLEKSAVQLVAFDKTETLEPGASETLTITFDAEYFASYDETAEKADGTVGAWSLEAGDYYFAVGNGAHAALNNILKAKGTADADLVTIVEDDAAAENTTQKWTLDTTDIETYSENVQNQLQDLDINNLVEGTVEYSTRADWTKGWTTIDAITPTEEMTAGLTNHQSELTENGEEVVWGADNGLKLLDMVTIEDGKITAVTPLSDEKWDQLIDEVTLDEAIQFIEKGGDDVENIDSIILPRTYANDGPIGFTADQVADYTYRWTADNANEAYYTTKEDDKATYTMCTMPLDPVVAATFNTDLAEEEGYLFGEDALWSNESSIFAPGINLHRTPYCARNHEYYSEDPMLTSLMGYAVCVGAEPTGIMMEPKHFAFNHQESNRSGVSTFLNEQAGRENELRCFQLVMSTNKAKGIMTAFNRAGVNYVGGYKPLLTNIARDEWGYTGWFNTDMINGADYMNWRDITAAGGGNCLTSGAYDGSRIGTMAASKSEIAKDAEFQTMMKTNLKYWFYTMVQSNAMNGLSQTATIQHVMTWYQKALYGGIAGLAVLTLLFAVVGLKKRKKYAQEA